MTTAIPTAPVELEEWVGTQANFDKWFDKAGKPTADFTTFLKNYAEGVRNRDETIATQVKEQVQSVVADMFRDNNKVVNKLQFDANGTPGIKGLPRQRGSHHHSAKALGAQLDGLYANSDNMLGDFFHDIWHNRGTSDSALNERLYKLKNSFGSQVPSDGGFLIPEILRSTLLTVALETAVVRPRAMVVPMDSMRVPFPAVDDTSHASSVFGGIVGYWTEDGANATESQASFGQVELESHDLTIYCEVPNNLVNDSVISFDAWLAQVMPQAISFFEDDAFLDGNGAGQPAGALNASAMVTVPKETNQAGSTIHWENIVKMYARMLPGSLNRAVWTVSPDTFPELATMALSVGTGGAAVWLPDGTGSPTMTLLGRPVVVTEKAEVLGTAGDVNFIDYGYYLVGDRQAMSVTSSPHYKFQSRKTAYMVVERVDGRPWLNSAITPRNGGNTLSPYVNLATRA